MVTRRHNYVDHAFEKFRKIRNDQIFKELREATVRTEPYRLVQWVNIRDRGESFYDYLYRLRR